MAGYGTLPGQPGRGGRKKGSQNRMTRDIKAAIEEAFVKAGGADYLARLAVEHPAVFCTLLGKVLPTQITGLNGGPVVLRWE